MVDPVVYLSDSMGKQVTPYARSKGMPDPLPLRAGVGPTAAYHTAHGNVTKDQKARALDLSLRAHVASGKLPPHFELVSSDEEDEEEEDVIIVDPKNVPRQQIAVRVPSQRSAPEASTQRPVLDVSPPWPALEVSRSPSLFTEDPLSGW